MYQMLTIVGRLGKDPEMRYTSSGTPVCSFSVATDRVWTNDQGVKQEEVTWHNVTTWNKQAETCAQYLTKGSMVMVTGTVKARGYTGRDGQVGASLDVKADVVRFLSGNRGANEAVGSGETVDPGAGGGADIPF